MASLLRSFIARLVPRHFITSLFRVAIRALFKLRHSLQYYSIIRYHFAPFRSLPFASFRFASFASFPLHSITLHSRSFFSYTCKTNASKFSRQQDFLITLKEGFVQKKNNTSLSSASAAIPSPGHLNS